MKYSCGCLNIIVDSEGEEAVVSNSVKKTISDRGITQVAVLVRSKLIIKRMISLIYAKPIDDWTEVQCLNCNVWVYYCKHMEENSPNATLIVNRTTMVDISMIERRQQDPQYSAIFKILIYDLDNTEDTDWRRSLHPMAVSWLNIQTVRAEARIKKYSDEQFEMIDKMKKRAYAEQSAINKAIERCKSAMQPSRSSEFQTTTMKVDIKQTGTPPEDVVQTQPKPNESLFDMDESLMFGSHFSPHSSQNSDESDDEPVATPPSRTLEQPMLARSLPIAVPTFLQERDIDGRSYREQSPQTPTDIAASIRALAQSVRGNTIFGELPPRRFPTKE